MPRPNPPKVVVVSTNPATRDPLLAYLREAGVSAASASKVANRPPDVAALVVFPDDFELPAVVREVASVRAASPKLLVLLVTSEPQRYVACTRGAGGAARILPKPVFGWTLLDAIRAHVEESTP